MGTPGLGYDRQGSAGMKHRLVLIKHGGPARVHALRVSAIRRSVVVDNDLQQQPLCFLPVDELTASAIAT